MLLIDFDTKEQRKKFFWICFTASLMLAIAGTVALCLILDKEDHFDALLTFCSMVIVLDVTLVSSAFMHKGVRRNLSPRISQGKLRMKRQELPEDTEGLAFSGFAPTTILCNISVFLIVLSDYIATVTGTLLLVFGIMGFVAAIVLIMLTAIHLQKYYVG